MSRVRTAELDRAVPGAHSMEEPAREKSQTGGDGLSIRPQLLQLSPLYRRARDSILRPHLRLTESRYFWEKWKARLGPDATVLIMEVRDRCNQGLQRGLQAASGDVADPGSLDGCTVSAVELAAACGFSRVTLWRLLQREDVRQFVRVEHNYVYDRRIGKKRRTVSTYQVLMEDPLVPEDEPRLAALLGSVPLAAAPTPAPAAPTFQTETEVVDNAPPRLHFETANGGSRQKQQNVEKTKLNQRLGETQTETVRGGTPSRLGNLLEAFGMPGQTGVSTGSHAATAPAKSLEPAGPARGMTRQMAPGRAAASALGAVAAPIADEAAGGRERDPDIWQRYPQFAHLIEEAEAMLGDRHSRGFYITALKRLYPGHVGVWQRALGLAREQQNIRRSRGALFTRLLRTFAAEAGVAL